MTTKKSADFDLLKIKNAKCYQITNKYTAYSYYILYDYSAGLKGRYTVLKYFGAYNHMKIIGRELPLGHCKSIIRNHLKKEFNIK